MPRGGTSLAAPGRVPGGPDPPPQEQQQQQQRTFVAGQAPGRVAAVWEPGQQGGGGRGPIPTHIPMHLGKVLRGPAVGAGGEAGRAGAEEGEQRLFVAGEAGLVQQAGKERGGA
jgi:hypothetical protein